MEYNTHLESDWGIKVTTINPAQLNVAVKRNGGVLLQVGSCGIAKSVSTADLITLCVRRARMHTE